MVLNHIKELDGSKYCGKVKMIVYKTGGKSSAPAKQSHLLRKTRKVSCKNQKTFSQSAVYVLTAGYGSYVIYSGESSEMKHRQPDFCKEWKVYSYN